MEYTYQNTFQTKDFFQANSKVFEQTLLSEAVNVKDKINEILTIGNIDLINNAHKIVVYIIDGEEEKLQAFAKQEGIAWATHSIELSFKLEWVQAIRRTLWNMIEKYNEFTNGSIKNDFFILENQINTLVDQFLNTFFISYSSFKDSLIYEQKKMVENLSVPIIPINPTVCILPLIGSVDSSRMDILEEKVLTDIGVSRIQTLIMDLSGIAEMDDDIVLRLRKITDSTAMMGCNTVITGLRKEVVKKMTKLQISFGENTRTLGTLQKALGEFFK